MSRLACGRGAGARFLRVREIPIIDETIRLGQLLKLAGVIDSGGEARSLLGAGGVSVNGAREERRGRQLRPGDEVRVGEQVLLVSTGGTAG
jgi:ribosome-associated protein